MLLDRLVVQPGLARLLTDAPLINVAGRQRMLSQRLCKAALAREAAANPDDSARRRAELHAVLALWTAAHARLRDEGGPAARRALAATESAFARMRAACEQLVQIEDAGARREPLTALLRDEPVFLDGMERVVAVYEADARARVRRLLATGWALTAAVLIALVAVGGAILAPAARLIERQMIALREARDTLEDRVHERTAALDRANRDLAVESQERARAEQRQRALVEQFSRVARTNTIGEMATGLAHELNQPLGALVNYAEGCIAALDTPAPALDELRATLDKIVATALRAGAIVKRIREFVARGETTREWFDPNALVREVAEFCRDEAERRGVALRTALAPDLPNVWGDPVQLQQVMVNLVRNALDAIDATEAREPTVVMATRRPQSDTVEWAVSDTGDGIPGDRIDRVFDAYFSTRDHGMGMGLAISRTIVESHQGTFTVESAPGAGATFRFTLPRASADDAGTDGLRR